MSFQNPNQRPGYGQGQNPFGGQGYPNQPGYRPMPRGMRGPGRRPASRRGGWRTGLSYATGFVILIWAVHIVNGVLFGGQLIVFGIHPLDLSSIWGIFTSPLLHADFSHLMSNTLPGAIFAFLIGHSGPRVFWEVTAIVVIVGGIGVWLFGGIGTNHIGASGLVYGWLTYLLIRGFFNRSLAEIGLGVTLGFIYSGLIFGLLPGTPGLSWQAHLFGAVGGVLAGMFITSDDPPHLVAYRSAKKDVRNGR